MDVPKIMVITGTGVILACIFIFLILRRTIQATIGSKGYLMNIFLLLIGLFFGGYTFIGHKMVSEEPINNNALLATILLLGSLFVLLSLLMMRQMVKKVTEAKMNQMDCATGLLNKNAGTQSIANRMERKEAYRAFYILDIDHFKSINDQYGHMEGDNLLKQIAYTLRNTTKGEDIVYRFGGDEFGIYASRDNRQELITLGESIIGNISEIQCRVKPDPIRITCSLGAAEICPDTTFDQIFRKADSVLYEVKKSQKGQFRMKMCSGAQTGLNFQDYDPTDRQPLTDIMKRAFDDDTRMHTDLLEDGPAGYKDGTLIDRLDAKSTIFQEIRYGGKLIGAFAIRETSASRAELDMLFIDPMRKSQGIGKLVWRRIEKKYPYQEWQVETPDYSNRNIHFYCETCGFHLIGKKTYDDGAGSVIMEKSVFVEKALT